MDVEGTKDKVNSNENNNSSISYEYCNKSNDSEINNSKESKPIITVTTEMNNTLVDIVENRMNKQLSDKILTAWIEGCIKQVVTTDINISACWHSLWPAVPKI